MSNRTSVSRRRFLKTAAKASTVFAAPCFIPGTALGKDGAVAPSERIVMGGIGIGRTGWVRPQLLSARSGRAIRGGV